MIICCKVLCNVLKLTRDDNKEILEFLKEETLYHGIQSILDTLPSCQTSMLILFHLTHLIILLCDYDDEIRSVFTKYNGIAILLSIYNFSLPPKQHADLAAFVGTMIRSLWSGRGSVALGCCNIHQLMSLLLWAVDNENAEDIEGSVGNNAMTMLLQFSSAREGDKLTEKQSILLKFGVPRLLALTGNVVSYSRFIKSPTQTLLLHYCDGILRLVYNLSEALNLFNVHLGGHSSRRVGSCHATCFRTESRTFSCALCVLRGFLAASAVAASSVCTHCCRTIRWQP